MPSGREGTPGVSSIPDYRGDWILVSNDWIQDSSIWITDTNITNMLKFRFPYMGLLPFFLKSCNLVIIKERQKESWCKNYI